MKEFTNKTDFYNDVDSAPIGALYLVVEMYSGWEEGEACNIGLLKKTDNPHSLDCVKCVKQEVQTMAFLANPYAYGDFTTYEDCEKFVIVKANDVSDYYKRYDEDCISDESDNWRPGDAPWEAPGMSEKDFF